MLILKKKFKLKKKFPGGDKLKCKPILTKLIKIKPKQGRWCEYYEGRLPYPLECSMNKEKPLTQIFKSEEVITLSNRENCVECKRSVEWPSWKKGDWDKIKQAIANGDDLTDMDPPNQEIK